MVGTWNSIFWFLAIWAATKQPLFLGNISRTWLSGWVGKYISGLKNPKYGMACPPKMAKIKKIVQFFFVWADFGFYQPQIKLNINFFDFFFTLSLQSKKFILSFDYKSVTFSQVFCYYLIDFPNLANSINHNLQKIQTKLLSILNISITKRCRIRMWCSKVQAFCWL